MVTSARVTDEKKKLDLKKRERFSHDYLQRLIVHEVGAHILRCENGKLQELKLFKNGLGKYLETEEGIAAHNEYRSGLMTNSIIRNYAGRVLAINYATKHSFKKTYTYLTKNFSKKTAFKLTLRAKRGIHDSSKKGAYTKDVVYLKGFLKVLNYSKDNEMENLYIGKIGIEDLKITNQIKDLVKPKYLLKNILHKITTSSQQINNEKLDKILNGFDLNKI
jgi:hypothetical protein